MNDRHELEKRNGGKKMKTYKLIENIESWGDEAYYGLTISEEELATLSREWDKDIDELMEDLEETND